MKALGFFLLSLFLVILFCTLGVWQVHRYHYKKNLLESYHHRLTMPAIDFSAIETVKDKDFLPVIVKGEYINKLTMLIQNRFYKDQLGYEVLTPFSIAGEQKLLLVDRGWIQDPKKINPILGTQKIKGQIKLLNENQFILGKNILKPNETPLVMQKINISEINQLLQKSFYPFVLRLDLSQPNGFVRDWVITTVIPERHLGYAIQWFAFALIVVIGYICFVLRGKNA